MSRSSNSEEGVSLPAETRSPHDTCEGNRVSLEPVDKVPSDHLPQDAVFLGRYRTPSLRTNSSSLQKFSSEVCKNSEFSNVGLASKGAEIEPVELCLSVVAQ